jgi:hypothetical protein
VLDAALRLSARLEALIEPLRRGAAAALEAALRGAP